MVSCWISLLRCKAVSDGLNCVHNNYGTFQSSCRSPCSNSNFDFGPGDTGPSHVPFYSLPAMQSPACRLQPYSAPPRKNSHLTPRSVFIRGSFPAAQWSISSYPQNPVILSKTPGTVVAMFRVFRNTISHIRVFCIRFYFTPSLSR